MANRLAKASSSYLLQHAENPVDWFEWGNEAWDKAVAENKPVFLSVGYSSCHWCHVMAHESFEDQTIAEILNKHFINVKLDREERPDIDEIYMTAVQLATGHGGWPMSVFLTPDKKPFFVGTYFPREARSGHPSFETILVNLADAWGAQEAEIREKADEFADGLARVLENSVAPVTPEISTELLDQSIQHFHSTFDYEEGGFGEQPKFPPHALLRFLMEFGHKRHRLPGDDHLVNALTEDAGHMTVLTLRKMAQGGIYDIVGGGFHRYATDGEWLLPHFEKMLYDNGQLLWLYATASNLVEDSDLKIYFQKVSEGICNWVVREMLAESGHLHSSLDADSPDPVSGHNEEGAYYVWTQAELVDLIGEELAFQFNARDGGNFCDEATGEPTGKNILHTHVPIVRPSEFDRLLEQRLSRPAPGRDAKCVCSSNGLMIAGLSRLGRLDVARSVADAWMKFEPDRLPHQVVNGVGEGHAFLDDYAFLCDGLVDLAELCGEAKYSDFAHKLADHMNELFAPDGQRGFNYTSHVHEELFGRTKPAMDNSAPSPNGVVIRALRRLGRKEEALHHLGGVYGWAQRLPQASATLLEECLFLLLDHNSASVTVANPDFQHLPIEIDPSPITIAADGFGYAELIIRIPDGMHINSHEPDAEWLTPTVLEVKGAFGEASYPQNNGARWSGTVRIPIRIRPRSDTDREFSVEITYQLCSSTECMLPTAQTIVGFIHQSG